MDSPNSKGLRFVPTAEEIIDYLKKKRLDPDFSVHGITELDMSNLEPSELPGFSVTPSKEEACYFYCDNGKRKPIRRKTNNGYWKSNGKVREMRAENSGEVIGTKRYLTFLSKDSASKKAKTKWVIHEISVEDDLRYKKDFVIRIIKRNWNKKRRNSTQEEGESSKQVVSPTQILPGDHLLSNGNHIDENIFTNPQLLPPNHNVISFPGNHIEQTSLSNHKPLPNHNMVSDPGNHIEQNAIPNLPLLPSNHNMVPYLENNFITLLNPQLLPPNHNLISDLGNHIEQNALPNHNLISDLGNHIEQNALPNLPPNHNMVPYLENHFVQNPLLNPQLLPPNHNLISDPGNHIEQNALPNLQLPPPNHNLISYLGNHILESTISNPPLLPNHNLISCFANHIEQNTNPQLVPNQNLTSYPRNQIEENTFTNPQLLSNYNMISFPWNHNEDNTFTELQLPPNSVSQPESKNTSQEEKHQLGEFNVGSGCNGLNYASFSTPQSLNYQEMELSYSNSSIDNFDFLNFQFDSEQVHDLINLQRAFQDENSLEETGQTHTPDFNSSKSDGRTYAEDSSDTNTETFNACFNEPLLENIG